MVRQAASDLGLDGNGKQQLVGNFRRFGFSWHSFRCSFEFRIDFEEPLGIEFRRALRVVQHLYELDSVVSNKNRTLNQMWTRKRLTTVSSTLQQLRSGILCSFLLGFGVCS